MNINLNDILKNIKEANGNNLDITIYENFGEKTTKTNIDDFLENSQNNN